MEKQYLLKLVEELNYKSLKFIHLSNKEKNPYYHLFNISFKIVKREMYIGDESAIINLLRVSVKRLNCNHKNHKEINIENHVSLDDLLYWELSKDVGIAVLEIIMMFKKQY